MDENKQKKMLFGIVVIFFRLVCIMFTISIVLFWIYKYSLNLDLCRVDFKNYHSSKLDVFPLLSLCFKEPFLEDKLLEYNTSVVSYMDYLQGKNSTVELERVPYDEVTMNMDQYAIGFYIQRTNGSYHYSKRKNGQTLMNISYDGYWFDDFYRCFALNIPQEKTLQGFGVQMKSDIFENGISTYNISLFLVDFPFHLSLIKLLSTLA